MQGYLQGQRFFSRSKCRENVLTVRDTLSVLYIFTYLLGFISMLKGLAQAKIIEKITDFSLASLYEHMM